jgi:hypothetical protein
LTAAETATDSFSSQASDYLPILVRTYVPTSHAASRPPRAARSTPDPSPYVLVFDTETTVDAGQSLRFGCYQERTGAELIESGIFYDPAALNSDEQAVVHSCASAHGIKVLTVREFIEDVFYGFAYDLRAVIVGFNLPFD